LEVGGEIDTVGSLEGRDGGRMGWYRRWRSSSSSSRRKRGRDATAAAAAAAAAAVGADLFA